MQHNQPQGSDFIGFNDSPRNHNFSPKQFSSPRFRGNNYKWHNNSNRSFNSRYSGSFNNSQSPRFYKNNRSHNKSLDAASYLHPSFFEDPWKELEAKLKLQQKQEETAEQRDSTDTAVEDN